MNKIKKINGHSILWVNSERLVSGLIGLVFTFRLVVDLKINSITTLTKCTLLTHNIKHPIFLSHKRDKQKQQYNNLLSLNGFNFVGLCRKLYPVWHYNINGIYNLM